MGAFFLPRSGEKLIKQGLRCEKTLCILHPVLCTIYSLAFVRFEPLNPRKYRLSPQTCGECGSRGADNVHYVKSGRFLTNYGAARMRGLFHIQGSLTDGS